MIDNISSIRKIILSRIDGKACKHAWLTRLLRIGSRIRAADVYIRYDKRYMNDP